jgi:hypothetical protein
MTSQPTGLSVPLALAAAAAALVWLGLFVVVILAKRPPRVRAKDTGMELPDEPPAVAGLLANDFVVTGESAPAVVLDLADRRVLDIDEVQPGNTVARVKSERDEDLAPYEHRVLRVLKDKAIDGLIPAAAMTTGPEEQSKRWQCALGREIVADAQARGLTRNRWTHRLISLLTVALVPAGALLFLAMDAGSEDDGWLGWAAGAVAGAVIALGAYGLVRMARSLAQLPTERGLAATELVAGLEAHLSENEVFADLPPAAVKLRGRHFAYAAAFGFAPLAVALLPMGAEDDHRAWSRVGGRWRRVRVRYPRMWPPAWGKHPAFAFVLSIFWAAFGIFMLVKLDDLARSAPPSGITADDWRWVELVARVLMVPFVAAVVWGLWVLFRSLGDLRTMRGDAPSLTGEIVRHRRFRQWHEWGHEARYWYYLAIDDGSDDRVVARRVRRELWSQRSQGEHVTARVTPSLGYVRDVKKA